MLTHKSTLLAMLATLAASAYAAPQGDLGQQIHKTYLETTMDASGMKVVKPGSTLVVQIDGVMANPLKNNLAPFQNTYENGEIKATEKKGLGGYLRRQAKEAIRTNQPERPVASGAKVYLLGVEYLPAQDSLSLTVQTCGDCDPKAVDPSMEPYRAKVTFKFVHGALAVTDMKHVQQAVEQVFKFPDADAGSAGNQAPPAAATPPAQQASPQQEAPPPEQQFAPIAPPAAPPPPPKQVKLGMTMQQVKDSLGEPVNIVDLGSKVIYKYSDLKITFMNGKVSDVE